MHRCLSAYAVNYIRTLVVVRRLLEKEVELTLTLTLTLTQP